jgi:protein-S-isoprenylcysteine O-methyltransferase Ste14
MIVIVLIYRINKEEDEFEKIIGKEYIDYKIKTKRIIPYIW